MDAYILIKYLHYLGIFGVVSSVVAEHLMLRSQLSRREVSRLSMIDAVYGVSAIVVVAAGLLMWFTVGKPSEYYTANWIFHAKLSLFVVIGVLSIFPSVYFFRNRKGDPGELVEVPAHLKTILRAELAMLLVIPLLAVLMAHGRGSF